MTARNAPEVFDSHYDSAVHHWKGRDKNSKEFAKDCAFVSKKDTAKLAAELKVSVDLIELHRNSYRMYRAMLTHLEDPEIDRLWRDANISLWTRGAKIRSARDMSYEKMFGYLATAFNKGMTVEAFGAYVDEEERERKVARWVRQLISFSNRIKNYFDGKFMESVPACKQERLRTLMDYVAVELAAIASEEEPVT